MLAGETMPTGPLGASLSTGMMMPAQPELNVPMTPITFLSAAYAAAFAEHTAESHLPACAVASSQDWYCTV